MVEVVFDCICMICNEWFSAEKTSDVDFLYNDGLYQGEPICKSCISVLHSCTIKNHLNYEPIRIRKPKGLEKWIK